METRSFEGGLGAEGSEWPGFPAFRSLSIYILELRGRLGEKKGRFGEIRGIGLGNRGIGPGILRIYYNCLEGKVDFML